MATLGERIRHYREGLGLTLEALSEKSTVDHVQPLCAGGADAPSNMQWQTAAAAKAKDRAERAQCRALRAPPRATRLYKC